MLRVERPPFGHIRTDENLMALSHQVAAVALRRIKQRVTEHIMHES